MNTTGGLPLSFARSTCCISRSLIVAAAVDEPCDGAVANGTPFLVSPAAGQGGASPLESVHSRPRPAESQALRRTGVCSSLLILEHLRWRSSRTGGPVPGGARERVATPATIRPTSSSNWSIPKLCEGTRTHAPDVNPANRRFVAAYDAGGGTRTPDARIMIPRLLGSTAPFEGAGRPKRGHIRASSCGPFRATAMTPALERRRSHA